MAARAFVGHRAFVATYFAEFVPGASTTPLNSNGRVAYTIELLVIFFRIQAL